MFFKIAKITFAKFICMAALLSTTLSCSSQQAVNFDQLYIGKNGPHRVGLEYFRSAVQLRESWIKQSLSTDEFNKLLSRVNFAKAVLIAYTAGEHEMFSGKIRVASVMLSTDIDESVNVGIQMGVLDDSCRKAKVEFPFVLAVITPPSNARLEGGFDFENFRDSCP